MNRFRLLALIAWMCCVLLGSAFIVGAQSVVPGSTLCETGCLLPPTGLVGWWPGDGSANDIQLGSNGILMNGATFAPGLVGQAFSFDGVDDFVDVPDTPALHAITTAVTVDAWVNPQIPLDRPAGSAVAEGWIFARRDPLVSEGISLGINAEGFLTTALQADSVSALASAAPVIQFDGKWKHVAVTADTATGQVRLYLNGQPLALQVVSGPPNLSGRFAQVTHLFIGQRQGLDTPEGQGGSLHYKGLMDEVEVYNRSLSADEIRATFTVGPRGMCKPLFGF